MSLFDVVLLIIIGGFGLFGLWFGLVHTLGSLIGTILGVFLATRFYAPVAGWLMSLTGWSGNFAKVLVFIVAFLVINRLVGFAFYLIDRLLGIITRLPFINSLNRLLGLAFGVLEGVIVLGILFYFINKFPLWPTLTNALLQSKVALFCVKTASVLWPLIPDALKTIKDTIQGII